MNIAEFFTNPEATDIIFKLFLAFVLAALIGIERELIHKPAGIKTHSLICISATLIMALGIYMKDTFGDIIDPSRLPSQILAGIGFVGAGTILRDGFSVKGITTAASLLAITCIGLAVGAGFYTGAIFATIFIFLILSFTSPIQNLLYRNRKQVLFTIKTTENESILGKIENIFQTYKAEIINIQKIKSKSRASYTYKIFSKCNEAKFKENILNDLSKIDNVHEVYTSKKAYRHDGE